MLFFRKQRSKNVKLLIFYEVANPFGNNSRRVVWLGRHPTEKISVGPKDKLIRLGNPEQSAEAKVCLTVSRKERDAELKDWLSEPTMTFNGSCG
jgi:hypothetical protein